jgi:hypothetical protein
MKTQESISKKPLKRLLGLLSGMEEPDIQFIATIAENIHYNHMEKDLSFSEKNLSAKDQKRLTVLRDEILLGEESYIEHGGSPLDIEKIKAAGRKRVSSSTS